MDDAAGGFEPGEIAVVCARYDIGDIVQAAPLAGGSRASPKATLTTEDGRRFVLKRRDARESAHVALTHAIQHRLARRRYPVAPLCATRDGATVVILDHGLYELFVFLEGCPYDRAITSTRDAGLALALFHRLLTRYIPANGETPQPGFHGAPWVRTAIDAIESRSPDAPRVGALYETAAQRVRAAGEASWPVQIIHGDWHPGNMLFRGGRVAGVVDFDSARLGRPILDIANGALQFSLVAGGSRCEQWPEAPDLGRLGAFLHGYEGAPASSSWDATLSRAELDVLPWLMIETLIAEAVAPIASHGRFGPHDGAAFLSMIARKSAWIAHHRDRIRRAVDGDTLDA